MYKKISLIIITTYIISQIFLFFPLLPKAYAYTQCPNGPADTFAPLTVSVTPSSGDTTTAFKATIHWQALKNSLDKTNPGAFNNYTPIVHILVVDYLGNVLSNPQAVDNANNRNGSDKSYGLAGIPASLNFYDIILSPDWTAGSTKFCIVGAARAAILVGINPNPGVTSPCPPGKADINSRCIKGIDSCTNPNDTGKICKPGLTCYEFPGDPTGQGLCSDKPPTLTCPQVGDKCNGTNDTTTCQSTDKKCSTTNLTCQQVQGGDKYSCQGKDFLNQQLTYAPIGPPPSPPCAAGFDTNGACKGIASALSSSNGSTSTDPSMFITQILQLLIGIAGSIALLLIIFSGYRLMVSQGKPEPVQAAREQLTAAIVGLLFLLLSLVIIQIIGADLLHVPGFGK